MRIPFVVVLIVALPWLVACSDPVSAKDDPADAVAALEGGTPMPSGAVEIQFPWMGKQSVMCVGDSFERQIAFADFSLDDAPDMLGHVSLKADATGSAKFTIPASALRTGHADRDRKLLEGAWLDAETHPDLILDIKHLEKLKPTVWRATGTWAVHGVAKAVTFLVNVRYLEEMQYLGKHIVRVSGRFDFDMQAHEIVNGSVGTPAVANTWTVDVGLLGIMVKK